MGTLVNIVVILLLAWLGVIVLLGLTAVFCTVFAAVTYLLRSSR